MIFVQEYGPNEIDTELQFTKGHIIPENNYWWWLNYYYYFKELGITCDHVGARENVDSLVETISEYDYVVLVFGDKLFSDWEDFNVHDIRIDLANLHKQVAKEGNKLIYALNYDGNGFRNLQKIRENNTIHEHLRLQLLDIYNVHCDGFITYLPHQESISLIEDLFQKNTLGFPPGLTVDLLADQKEIYDRKANLTFPEEDSFKNGWTLLTHAGPCTFFYYADEIYEGPKNIFSYKHNLEEPEMADFTKKRLINAIEVQPHAVWASLIARSKGVLNPCDHLPLGTVTVPALMGHKPSAGDGAYQEYFYPDLRIQGHPNELGEIRALISNYDEFAPRYVDEALLKLDVMIPTGAEKLNNFLRSL